MDSKDSLLAMLGKCIAPIFIPLGFNDWRVATSLISGFSAKEAVVSTLSVLTGTTMSTLSESLGTIFTPVSAISFLVFTLLYTPCVAAVATIKREMASSWKAFLVVLMQCAVAWVVSFAVYNVLRTIIV